MKSYITFLTIIFLLLFSCTQPNTAGERTKKNHQLSINFKQFWVCATARSFFCI